MQAAVSHLQAAKVAIIPTDTVYGIGALASDARAVAQVLAAKGRGRQMPPPVLVSDICQLDGVVANIPAPARALMEAYWPGALTLILPAHPDLSWDLGETGGTVAVRQPNYPLTLQLLSQTGPLAVTSANLTGQPPPRRVLTLVRRSTRARFTCSTTAPPPARYPPLSFLSQPPSLRCCV